MKCSEIMSQELQVCTGKNSAEDVAKMMKEGDIGPIPVVSQPDSKLVGIVTDRDVTVRVVAEGKDAKSVKVLEFMTKEPERCYPYDSVEDALKKMTEHQVRRMPIVDEENILIGIISQADIARELENPEKTADLVSGISK